MASRGGGGRKGAEAEGAGETGAGAAGEGEGAAGAAGEGAAGAAGGAAEASRGDRLPHCAYVCHPPQSVLRCGRGASCRPVLHFSDTHVCAITWVCNASWTCKIASLQRTRAGDPIYKSRT